MEAREGLIRAAKELLTQHDKELAMARKAFSEEGCADDLSPRDGKTSPMNLLYAGRLLSLSLDHDRLTGFTHYAVKQIKDLIRSVQNKRYTCPHAILNFMVFTQVEITLKQVGLRLLGTTKAPEQREELLRILRADLNADSERGDREAFQQSVRVEFLQNKQLLQESGLLKGMKTLRPAQKTESALNFWPFLDEEEAIEWLSEAARAQVWILGVPAHEELPADLRVSRFKEELDTFSNPWMYNGFGAQLFKVLHMSVSALRDTHIRSNCQWRYRFKKELDRLKIEGPAIINPYTTRSFKQRRNPCQPRAPYDRL